MIRPTSLMNEGFFFCCYDRPSLSSSEGCLYPPSFDRVLWNSLPNVRPHHLQPPSSPPREPLTTSDNTPRNTGQAPSLRLPEPPEPSSSTQTPPLTTIISTGASPTILYPRSEAPSFPMRSKRTLAAAKISAISRLLQRRSEHTSFTSKEDPTINTDHQIRRPRQVSATKISQETTIAPSPSCSISSLDAGPSQSTFTGGLPTCCPA